MPDQTGMFVWYELLTPDPDGAKAFYDSVIGWTVEQHSAFPNGYRMIGRSDGMNAGGVIPLSDEMQAHGARPIWLGYIAVADVDRTVAAVEESGGKALMPPFDIPNVGRVAMVSDPAGAPVYVMAPTPPAEQPDAQSDVFSVDQPQHVRWNELTTSDPDGAVGFYSRQFGWGQEGSMPMGPAGDYRFVQHGSVNIGAISPQMQPDAPTGWIYYIGVDDIDRATSAVTSGGGQVLMGPHEIPGGEYSLIGLDPQGATFGLVGPRRA